MTANRDTLLQRPTSSVVVHLDRKAASLHASVAISCSKATLYKVWSDVARWHQWDPDTQWAQLEGPFQAGTVGRIKPKKGFSAKMVVLEADPMRGFTVACPVIGSRMVFRHVMEQQPGNLSVTHTVVMEGWLRKALMIGVGRGLVHGLPLTLSRLKALCEAMERGTWSTSPA
jgi:hypothetical protein